MTLDDWMGACDTLPVQTAFHPVIERLKKDLFGMLGKYKHHDEDYKIWEHVPKLGLRYQIWYTEVAEYDERKMNAIIERYNRFNLEVSFNKVKRTDGYDFMVSTMWKDYKEPETTCKHTKYCNTFAIGCAGTHYWCGRYERNDT